MESSRTSAGVGLGVGIFLLALATAIIHLYLGLSFSNTLFVLNGLGYLGVEESSLGEAKSLRVIRSAWWEGGLS